MISPDVIEYVKKSRERGVTDPEIRVALQKNGWGESDLNMLFDNGHTSRAIKFPLLFSVVGILLLMAVGVFIYVYPNIKSNVETLDGVSQPLKDGASDLRIFENKELQISFKYPANWTVFEPATLGMGSAIATLGTSDQAYGSWARPIPQNESFVTLLGQPGSISDAKDELNQMFEQIESSNAKEPDRNKHTNYKIVSEGELTISGNRVSKRITTITKGPLAQSDASEGYFVTYYYENKDFVYILMFWTSNPLNNISQEHLDSFDKLARSLKYKIATINELLGKKSANSGGQVVGSGSAD